MRRHLAKALGLLAALALAGCQPTFKSEGSVTLDGAPFRPSACHTLATGGIELLEQGGGRLVLTIPPTRLEAMQEFTETPLVRLEPGSGRPAVELGGCGALVLHGEGYHAEGRRAAGGQVSFNCAHGAALQGELSFTGCF
jgi:hypothetical protein